LMFDGILFDRLDRLFGWNSESQMECLISDSLVSLVPISATYFQFLLALFPFLTSPSSGSSPSTGSSSSLTSSSDSSSLSPLGMVSGSRAKITYGNFVVTVLLLLQHEPSVDNPFGTMAMDVEEICTLDTGLPG
jgi:hypothetical protein